MYSPTFSCPGSFSPASSQYPSTPPFGFSEDLKGRAGYGVPTSLYSAYQYREPPSTCSSGDELSSCSSPLELKALFEREVCPVCGDKVSGYHYGLMTCESCKGFFKRTVQNNKKYQCVDNKMCVIDKSQRKRCPHCRFQKCLDVGMKLEAVRQDRMRGGRNKFGPLYKRDRAMKQQAVRHQQSWMVQLQARGGNLPHDLIPDVKPGIGGGFGPDFHGPFIPDVCMKPELRDKPSVNTPGTEQIPYSYSTPPNFPQNQPHPVGCASFMPGSNPSDIQALQHPASDCSSTQRTLDWMLHTEQIEADNCRELIEFLRNITRKRCQVTCSTTFSPAELSLFFFKLTDQALYLLVEWAKGCRFFTGLKVEDQTRLVETSWSDLLTFKLVYSLVSGDSSTLCQALNQHFGSNYLSELGLSQHYSVVVGLSEKLSSLQLSRAEFATLKYMMLLNPEAPDLEARSSVASVQEAANTALQELSSRATGGDPVHRMALIFGCVQEISGLARALKVVLHQQLAIAETVQGVLLAPSLLLEMLQKGA